MPVRLRPTRTAWRLVVVALAIVGFFMASTLYSQHVAAKLDDAAVSIASNASPSIEALSAMRGEVLRAEVAVTRADEGSPSARAGERHTAEEALARMRLRRADYLGLAFYPGERERWDQVDSAIHTFEEQIAAAFAAIEGGRTTEVRDILADRLRPATERLDEALERQVGFDAEQQHRLGIDIPKLRRHAAHVAYVLYAISALFAVVLISLVLAESRRRQHLLAHFGNRLEQIAAATVRIASALSTAGNRRSVLSATVEEAARLVDADFAALGFTRNPEQPFQDFVFRGFSAAEVEAIGRYPRAIGVLGRVITDGHTLRTDDVSQHPSFIGLPDGHPALAAFLGVPVRREGGAIGNLYLARRPGRAPFSAEDEHIIELLAAHAAVTIDNARLYEELAERRARAQLLADASARMDGSLEYETTLEQAANAALPGFADVCVLHVTDDSGAITRMIMAAAEPAWRLFLERLAPHYGRPPERHPAPRALRERRSLRYAVDEETLTQIAQNDEHRRMLEQIPVKQGLSTPIVGSARLLGVISFFRFSDTEFGDADVAFAEELARRAALAFDNAIMHERTRRALQARDDMLAIVSHDLRNPLTSIRMCCELLRRASAADAARRDSVTSRIARTADGMMHLIEDMLDASKMESGTFTVDAKPEPAEPLLTEALDLFREAASSQSIALRCEVGGDVPDVLCDRERILQVFSNLLGNAIKFTPAAGTITVSATRLDSDVRFEVCDSGPGIPAAERQHVFDRYWQAQHSRRAGAGLGLFIVRGIVEAHGGRVWADDGPAGGACLCFTLPTYATPSQQRGQRPELAQPPAMR